MNLRRILIGLLMSILQKNAIIYNAAEYRETQNLKKSIYSIISWFPLFNLMDKIVSNEDNGFSVSGVVCHLWNKNSFWMKPL